MAVGAEGRSCLSENCRLSLSTDMIHLWAKQADVESLKSKVSAS